jgi:hypothetical protein
MRALLLLTLTLSAYAPNLNPIRWALTAQPDQLILHTSIAENYKLFAPTKTTPGPIPMRLRNLSPNLVQLGKPKAQAAEERLSGEVDFTIPFKLRRKLPPEGLTLQLEVEYQSCSDVICLPPTKRRLEAKLLPANPVL